MKWVAWSRMHCESHECTLRNANRQLNRVLNSDDLLWFERFEQNASMNHSRTASSYNANAVHKWTTLCNIVRAAKREELAHAAAATAEARRERGSYENNRWCMRVVSACSVWLKKGRKNWFHYAYAAGRAVCVQLRLSGLLASLLALAFERRLSVCCILSGEDSARCCKCRERSLLYSFCFHFFTNSAVAKKGTRLTL